MKTIIYNLIHLGVAGVIVLVIATVATILYNQLFEKHEH